MKKFVKSHFQLLKALSLVVFVLIGVAFQAKKEFIELGGTTWEYYSNGEYNGYTIQFSAEGVLITSHPLDVTPNNDGWEQKGKKVKFWFNSHFSDYQGKVINSALIRGKAVNQHKKTWQWELRRVLPKQENKKDTLAQ